MPRILRILASPLLIAAAAFAAAAQQVAIAAPVDSPLERSVAAELASALSVKLRLQDPDMTSAAFSASKPADSFNMTAEESRRIGAAIGTDLMIVVNTGTRRRAALDGPDQFESFAVLYFVNCRTGLMANWKLINAAAATENESQIKLLKVLQTNSDEMINATKVALDDPRNSLSKNVVEEIPAADSSAAKSFRAPVPFRRLKPEYSRSAYLYDVTATVEATVELNEKGDITDLEITRWAGFGLDENVIAVVRSMNWRPAERNGKPLRIRFLLRYNFKKIEKDDNE